MIHCKNLLFLIFFIPIISIGMSCIPVTAEIQTNTTTLIGLYLVGSDLESEDGYGTADIIQMIDGYADTNPDILNLIIAYGGAFTPEWTGMTIATIEDLKVDGEDSIIGNDEHYQYRDRNANMGDIASLSQFLSTLDDVSREQAFLIFWDHGEAYNGFGYDENYADQLSIDEMTQALEEHDGWYDLIGFDACLMGSLEVASRFTPYTRYFLASEEMEPGEGWNYTDIIQSLLQTRSPDPVLFGEIVIDSFIAETGQDSTLSLMDLNTTALLLTQLDALGYSLASQTKEPALYASVGSAYKKTKAFGSIPRERTESSLDLTNLLQNVRDAVPQVSTDIENVISVLPSFVIYEKHGSMSPNIGGIAISSPRFLDSTGYTDLADTLSLTEGWDRFFASYITKKTDDITKPEFVVQDEGTYNLIDRYDTADVGIDYYAFDDDGMMILGSEPAFPQPDGFYQLPQWTGEWYFLTNPDKEGEYALLEMYYVEEYTDGSLVYSSDIDIEHDKKTDMAIMNTIFSPETGEITTSVLPYTLRENGEILYAKKTIVPEPGDKITTYASYLSDTSEEEELIPIGTITVTDETKIVHAVLPDGIYAYGLYAEYYNGEGDYADMQVIEIAGYDIIPLSFSSEYDGYYDSETEQYP